MPGFSLRDDDDVEALEGIWTPYGPEPTAEERAEGKVQERFKIRLLAPSNLTHFATVSTKPKWVNHQLQEVRDDARYNELMYDHLIEDWEGVYADKAQKVPAPCTLANKVRLMTTSLDRQNFIILQGSLYANDDEARKAAQRESFRSSTPVQIGLPGAEL